MTNKEGLATLHRLRRLHAMALELYLARHLMGEDGEPQKKRLLWLEGKILIYEHFEKKLKNRIMKYTGESFKKAILDFYQRIGRTITDEDMNAIEAKAYQLDHEFALKPFEQVLVRNSPIGLWIPALYGKYVDGKHLTSAGRQSECVRYEGNEDLIGTNTPK